ncbi:hypothetical protein E7811_16885 [Aliigemmobacter aestuarii]|uniref:Prepilin type IV endopeptidase peptidase domain-containing protein n=1 Tax=Aliigemmobacter aestuarii TaxID=1445661 RepID=A0A4S3MJK9_9RHOB|nr:prepilin peptidase [Gemmobacter aestuarii]THD81577.1 hypothetical protein E7811_16885 [Gemmobacter aestuarii]
MLSQTAAWVFLIGAAPIAIWVAWSDMKYMRIPNKAVLALAAVFIATGLFVLPQSAYLWGLGLGAIVLVITFLMSSMGLIGAGDAKYAAAMAPFFVGANAGALFVIAASTILAAFVAHRVLKNTPFRSATADWASWEHAKFPFGLPMSGTLLFYLFSPILAAI